MLGLEYGSSDDEETQNNEATAAGPPAGPSGPPQQYESYPEAEDYAPSVGPSGPPQQYESYPEPEDYGPSVGPSGPPQQYESYPEADEAVDDEGAEYDGAENSQADEGVIIGDDPDEIEARERAERQAALMARAAASAVPRPGAMQPTQTPDSSQTHQVVREEAITEAVYAHANGEPPEVVRVVSHLSENEGGGVLIYVPSLDRERSTIESRLTFGDAAVADCRQSATSSIAGTAPAVTTPAAAVASDGDGSVAADLAAPNSSGSSLPSASENPHFPGSETSGNGVAKDESVTPGVAAPTAPDAAAVVVAPTAEVGAAPVQPGPLPAPWIETPAQDGSGDSYYWNPDTSETTWVRPIAPAAEPAARPTPSLPSACAPVDSLATPGAIPAVANAPASSSTAAQSHTNAAATVAAVGHVGNSGGPYSTATGPPLPPGPALQPGWVQTFDPRTGAPYYFHAASGQSSWQPPLCQPPMYAQPPPPGAAVYGQAGGPPQYYGQSMPPYGQPMPQGQNMNLAGGTSGGPAKSGKDPFAGLTGAARRDAKRKAAGLDTGKGNKGPREGAVSDMMDVSHSAYSTDFQCLSADQEKRQKLADAKAGLVSGVRNGAAASAVSGDGGNKALPSPGEILRMNAGGRAPEPPPEASAAAAAKPAAPALKTKEDIMRLIAEEDQKAKVSRANLEAKEAMAEKKAAWLGQNRDKGKGGDAPAPKGAKGGGGDGSAANAGSKGPVKGPGGGGAKKAPRVEEVSANGAWMAQIKKTRR